MVNCRRCLSLLVGLLASPAWAAPTVDEQLSDLRRRLDEQGAELQQLRAAPPGVRIALHGFVQADVVAFQQASVDELDPSTGEPLNLTRFLLRRARLRVEVEQRYVGGTLEFDGNTVRGPVARVTNAEVWVRLPSRTVLPWLRLVVGLLRIPYGFEVQERDDQRLFLERSTLARALFPGEFDLGARLEGNWRWLRVQCAVLNGHPAGDAQFALRDPTETKELVGHVGVDAGGGRVRVQAGVSAVWGTGFHAGTAATKDTVIWRDANLDGQVDATELIGVPGMAAVASQSFGRWGFGGDVRLTVEVPRLGPLVVAGELSVASDLDRAIVPADPVAVGRSARELGGYVLVSQALTKWAAIGFRYDRYDPDADAQERVAANVVPRDLSISTWSVVAAVMYAPWARLTLQWDRQTNPFGRTAAGAPTTLGRDAVTLRAQVVF